MLIEDKTNKRNERHHITQEDFTPQNICEMLYENLNSDIYVDFNKTFCDIASGNGNIIRYILNKRLEQCSNQEDILNALKSIYGVELMQDNVEECHSLIIEDIKYFSKNKNIKINECDILNILKHNIVCSDMFDWDFDKWTSKKNSINALF